MLWYILSNAFSELFFRDDEPGLVSRLRQAGIIVALCAALFVFLYGTTTGIVAACGLLFGAPWFEEFVSSGNLLVVLLTLFAAAVAWCLFDTEDDEYDAWGGSGSGRRSYSWGSSPWEAPKDRPGQPVAPGACGCRTGHTCYMNASIQALSCAAPSATSFSTSRRPCRGTTSSARQGLRGFPGPAPAHVERQVPERRAQ